LLALRLAAPLLLPLDILSISLLSHNTRTHTPHTLPKHTHWLHFLLFCFTQIVMLTTL
jgi:hypothetical protein